MTAKLTAVIAAILAAGCGRSEPPVEEKSANPAAELPANPAPKPKPVEPAAKVTRPELPPKEPAAIVKPPEISIWEAARNGNIDAVRLHFTAGADANIRDEGGWLPLHGASGSGHREIVELLLANGAKVNGPAMSGKNGPRLRIQGRPEGNRRFLAPTRRKNTRGTERRKEMNRRLKFS